MYVLLYCGVCTLVRLLPPGENPTAVRNNNNNNNKMMEKIETDLRYSLLTDWIGVIL
jgi:hypothetical protein